MNLFTYLIQIMNNFLIIDIIKLYMTILYIQLLCNNEAAQTLIIHHAQCSNNNICIVAYSGFLLYYKGIDCIVTKYQYPV